MRRADQNAAWFTIIQVPRLKRVPTEGHQHSIWAMRISIGSRSDSKLRKKKINKAGSCKQNR